jgi:trans-aconitate 2-methyltransferase
VTDWNPATYLQFADERARPFLDLVARIGDDGPGRVVDLGCGPGNLTRVLADRWPNADVVGMDSSPAMIERARHEAGSRVRFLVGDLRGWRPDPPVDVLVSNATLQWVPEHRRLLPRLVESVQPGGWFAFQVPGNFEEPSHRLLAETADEPRFADYTRGLERPSAAQPAEYLADLAGLGCRVDAWETTYLHVLTGPDPVFRWISGTGARPVLAALPAGLREDFERTYKARLRRAYPAQAVGTVLPFRRVFVVAQRQEETS